MALKLVDVAGASAVVVTDGAPGTPSPWRVTETPGSVPPDSSTTFPVISPVVRCAYAGAIPPASSNATTHDHTRTMSPPERTFTNRCDEDDCCGAITMPAHRQGATGVPRHTHVCTRDEDTCDFRP